MAKLQKLQICGIRSFGPYEDQSQQLKFATPLTLILGQNGCGKTTIIEAIKYACTGDLPGGTNSGQGFVNDPKMSGNASTKGQIKLKLLDPRNNEVTISRVVELVQTSSSLKFSTKSSTIRVVTPNGEESSIAGRCVDITSECCQIMNVSPSVLNNVIFCHQENSAWPLDEGKKVKEKFDEIFDAQKYNKCVETIRKMSKAKQESIKRLKLELSYRQEKKEQVEKDNRTLQNKEDRLQLYEEDINNKKTQLEPIYKRIDEIFELEKVLSALEKDLASKEATKKGVVEEQNTIRLNLAFEFEGDDNDLQEKITSFERDRNKDENMILDMERRENDIEIKTKGIHKALEEAQTQVGKLRQQKSQNETKCSERKMLIEQAKNKMDVKDQASFNDNDGAKAAINQLKTTLGNYEQSLKTLIESKEKEQASLQVAIDESRETTAKTRQDVVSKTREINECERKIEDITNELITISSSDDLLDNCTKRLDTISKNIFNLTNSFKETEESQKMDTYRHDIQSMEHTLGTLEADHRVLLQNDITEGKMESEKQLIMEKQREINRIKSKHSNSLKQLFGDTVPERRLKECVLTKQQNADNTVKNLTERLNKKQKDVTTLEVQLQNQTEKITNCQKEIKSNRERISQVCNGKDFNEALESSYQKKERLQIDKGQYSSVKIIYGQYIKKFEEKEPCCPVCETSFVNKSNAVQKIIATLKTKLGKVPQELIRVENELQKEEAFYSKLQQLKFVNNETQVLADEKLPQLEQKLNEIKRDLDNNKTELAELKNQLVEPQKIVEISKNIISDVSRLDQNQNDVDKSQRTVEMLKQDLVQVASNKSKQEVEAEIDSVKSEISELRRKIDSLNKIINNHKDRLHQLAQERTVLVQKQMRLKESIQSRPLLETQKTELNEKVKSLKDEVSELKSNLELLEAELENFKANKELVTQKNKAEIEGERNKIASYRKLVQDIEKLQKDIDDYLNNEVDRKLVDIEKSLEEYRTKENTLQSTKTELLQLISEKKEDLAKQELRFRTLKSNVILREKKVLEASLESEIQDLKNRIGGHNYRTVYEEKRQLHLQRENLDKQINNLTGEKTALSQQIEELRQQLAKPENKKAYSNYMAKYYELKIAENVLKDQELYVTVLEKAILDFHKAKMMQINKNIRELWRNTYRGNDIDHIEIKTDPGSTGSAKKRSYNYRVVQVKKGIELDMRGRCSAGQKVLACLIIRMALAETLSSNCGILALDEPTTNLDRENIQSLAQTLSLIVNARQQEKNFQLLIITHDEEFLNTLTRVQGVSYYYRVLRDNEGFSIIKKEYSSTV